MQTPDTAMIGKICMVTGANSGIGKYTALALAQQGAHVVMVCRSRPRGEAARTEIVQRSGNQNVALLLADLSSQQAIRQLVEDFKQQYGQIHVLINNAGGVFLRRSLSVDGLEMTFAVNYLAGFLLTNLLLDTLKASAPSRIVNVSSQAHMEGFIKLDDLQAEQDYQLMRAYGQSKLAQILFTYALARRLEGTGVTVNCLHPGVVATNIWGQPLPNFLKPLVGAISKSFGISPEEGAKTVIYLATSPEVAQVTGKYFSKCKERPSAQISYDTSLQERLWDLSMEMAKLPS